MILILPFRRIALEFEGVQEAAPSVALAIACHKGNANQQQSNQETGAQTGGTAISGGNSNKVLTASGNTNSPVSTYELSTGPTSGKGAVSNVTLTDNGAVSQAVQLAQAALDSVSSANQAALASNANLASTYAATTQDLSNGAGAITTIMKEALAVTALGVVGWLAFQLIKK